MRNIFIGIDFSKSTFDATLLIVSASGAQNGETCREHRKFNNNKNGFRSCLTWAKKATGQKPSDGWLFCGENTGHYSLRMSNFLFHKGLFMWLEMPLRIKLSMGLVRGKSDKVDSERIADYAMRHQDKAVRYEQVSGTIAKLRTLLLNRLLLVKERKALAVRSNDFKEMGDEVAGAKIICSVNAPVLASIDAAIKNCDTEIKRLIKADEDVRRTFYSITSIKGIALINAVAFIAYTNNFKEFGGDARKIAAYWGVAVFSESSGTSVHKAARTCPMASRMLKSLITEAAQAAVKWEPRIRDYYEGLLKRGKHPGVALNNVKNKLIHIVTALATSGRTYDPYYEQNRIIGQTA